MKCNPIKIVSILQNGIKILRRKFNDLTFIIISFIFSLNICEGIYFYINQLILFDVYLFFKKIKHLMNKDLKIISNLTKIKYIIKIITIIIYLLPIYESIDPLWKYFFDLFQLINRYFLLYLRNHIVKSSIQVFFRWASKFFWKKWKSPNLHLKKLIFFLNWMS